MHQINFYRLENNMKLVSWNVNGIRACITKGFEESFAKLDADIFLSSGDQMSGEPGEAGASRLLSILELREPQRIFRNSCFYKKKNRCP